MCQSKSQGGRRCAAHNNQREFARAKRELKDAVRARDSLIAAHEAGNARVSEADIAAAEHEVLVRADLAMLMDPKLTDEQLEAMWDSASPEVQAAARPVAASVIAHGKAAAKLSGEASTARMFDRDDEAAAFDEQAEEERGKALRLVDALRSALAVTKTAVSEGVQDTVSGDGTTVTGEIIGVMRDFAAETGAALRDGLDETAAAVGDGVDEMVDALAAGVGIGAPVETGHGGDVGSSDDGESSDDESTAAEGVDDDCDDCTAAADGSGDDDAEGVADDSAAAADDESTPSIGDGPRRAPAQPPAQAKAAGTSTAEATDSASASDGHGPAQVKGADESSASAGTGQNKSEGSTPTPSTRATAGRTPAPGIGHGNGITPKPQPQPVRGVKAEPSAPALGTPQKAEEPFDVTRLSDSELLAFISRLYTKLRG